MITRELPPTAGLPLSLQDILAAFSSAPEGRFEEQLAAYLRLPELKLYSSGTLCLSVAFEALREHTGRKRVIVPAYTCPLVPIAAHAAGVEVVLCDTRTDSCEFDLAMLARLCDRSIAAVVPADLAGLPCDIAPVKKLAAGASAYVLEDAAQSLGAFRNGRAAGSESDIVVYSLAAGKGLSLYDGGIMSVLNPELRQIVEKVAARRIRKQPQLNLLRFGQLLGLWLFYNPAGLSFVYGQELRRWLRKGDPIRAAGEHFDLAVPAYEIECQRKRIGASALKRLPEFVRENRLRGLRRREIVANELGLRVLGEDGVSEGSWPFLMILTDTQAQRDRIMEKLWCSGRGVTRLFIHDLPSYHYLREIVPQVPMPNAHSFAARSFSITNSHFLSEAEFAHIVQSIRPLIAPTGRRD